MSERDVRRIEVLTEVLSGRRTIASAAVVLAITARQVNRLLIRFREDGGGGLIHKGRGQSSNHSMSAGVREYVLDLVKSKYADFGPTLATEVLLAKHDIQVGRETLRSWMLEEGLWLSRKQRRSFHQPRLRRESQGELVQIDGSQHRWFENRGEPYTSLVFIDDARRRLMQLRFVPNESTSSYFEANSSQAKGRVERANRTLQDRLVKELRLENVCDMDAGNAFLPGFPERFNERFALPAARPENLHRPLNVKTDRLNDILCHREQRYVSEQLTMSYDRKQIILERNERTEGLGGKYVNLFEFPDDTLEVRSKGHSLPYRLFSKDQRVSHTAVVDNKRLSHALTIIKAQQEVKREPKVQTNSEKIGYKKRPRQVYGPDYKQPNTPAAEAVEMTA